VISCVKEVGEALVRSLVSVSLSDFLTVHGMSKLIDRFEQNEVEG